MAAGGGVLLALLALLAAGPARAGQLLSQVAFYQRTESPPRESGGFVLELDADEILHADLDAKEIGWRLPAFPALAGFELQEALRGLAGLKRDMEMMIDMSNRTRAHNVPPEVTVFPEDPTELGEPNVLICLADKFSPPVLNITWLKNGQEVVDGVVETVFYPREDNTFRKFSYLPFVPTRGDYYDCRVEHWGLPKALLKHWEPQVPLPVSESTETLVCALGLAVGVAGIVAGTVLIAKAQR